MFDVLNVWLNEPLTNGDFLSLIFLILLSFCYTALSYIVNRDKFNHLDMMFLLHNAAFNNHLRNYHDVDIKGGDEGDFDK